MSPTKRSSRSSRTAKGRQPLNQDARVSKPKVAGKKPRSALHATNIKTKAAKSIHRSRIPDLPVEVISNILRLSHVREVGHNIMVHPRRSIIEEHKSRHCLPGARTRRRHASEQANLEMLAKAKFDLPAANLLLVNKLFRDEGLKQFYSNNVFSFVNDYTFSGNITSLSQTKKNHIRQVVIDSTWVLKLDLEEDLQGGIEWKIVRDHGRCIMNELLDLPSIATITLRVRCRAQLHHLLAELGFNWKMDNCEAVFVRDSDQLLGYQEVRDGMKASIANDIEAEYTAGGVSTQRLLPLIKVALCYSPMDTWKGDERVVSLSDIERDAAKFGLKG